jgi:hypothetical protein
MPIEKGWMMTNNHHFLPCGCLAGYELCFDCRVGLNRLATDQRTVAERQWQKPTLAPKPQQPCDIGLFSDDANQLDLVEMLHDPTND